ncbi:MAG: putative transporter [Rikenellaceae bacterium]
MDWINELLFSKSIVSSILLIALTISVGVFLGKFKFKGVSLGIAWILFFGIFLSHFGMTLNEDVAHFAKEFGLILFVYSIGLQVGPGFFASLKKGGLSLNMLAAAIVVLGCVVTYIIHIVSGTDLPSMIGVMTGAITNTPSLGAAQQAFHDMTGSDPSTIALGYAVAYPLGVMGIIFSIMLLRALFAKRLRLNAVTSSSSGSNTNVVHLDVKVTNQAVVGRTVKNIIDLINREFMISRIIHEDLSSDVAYHSTVVHQGDILRIITKFDSVDAIVAFLGESVKVESKQIKANSNVVIRKIMVTKEYVNGKQIGALNILQRYGVNITRIRRSGLELIGSADLRLQLGDRLTVVGKEEDILKVVDLMGNSEKRLDHPNLFPIFFGILIGVVVGLIPISIPGMPESVRLGVAGGPLIVAILISRFGPNYKMVTFTTTSANMMLREVGITLFLASVGLSAGERFMSTILSGGLWWVLYGVMITIIPLLIVGLMGIFIFKIDANSMMGLLSGATTDPPALAYSNSQASDDKASVAYATVYPLTMFLRVIAAQIMMLIALA